MCNMRLTINFQFLKTMKLFKIKFWFEHRYEVFVLMYNTFAIFPVSTISWRTPYHNSWLKFWTHLPCCLISWGSSNAKMISALILSPINTVKYIKVKWYFSWHFSVLLCQLNTKDIFRQPPVLQKSWFLKSFYLKSNCYYIENVMTKVFF